MLMRVNNELISHLLDVDDICKERVEKLVKEMAKTENVDKKFKTFYILSFNRKIMKMF